jgi:hypothetical protein
MNNNIVPMPTQNPWVWVDMGMGMGGHGHGYGYGHPMQGSDADSTFKLTYSHAFKIMSQYTYQKDIIHVYMLKSPFEV